MLNQERQKYLISFGILAALVCVYYWDYLTGTTFFWDDALKEIYPGVDYLCRSFASGRFPFWISGVRDGMPFYSDIQMGVFYPPHWLLVPFVFTGHLSPIAYQWFIVGHLLLGGGCLFFFLKDHGLQPISCLIGGVIFSFAGFSALHIIHFNMLEVYAWIPLQMLAVKRVINTRNFRYYFLLGAAILLSFLAGHPQTTVYTAYFVIAYWLFLASTTQPDYPNGQRGIQWQCFAHEIPKVALVYLLVIAVAGVIFLPSIENWKQSGRTEQTYESTTELSVPIPTFLQIFFPNFFGKVDPSSSTQTYWGCTTSESPIANIRDMHHYWEFGMYAGQLSVIALLVMLTNRRFLRTNLPATFFCCVVILSLWFSLGKHGGLFTLLYHVLPGASLFRGPSKIACALDCAAAVVTAFFVDAVLRRENLAPKKRILTLAACYAGFLAMLWAAGNWLFPQITMGNRLHYALIQTVIGIAILLLVMVAILGIASHRLWIRHCAMSGLVVITLGDLYLAYGDFHKGNVNATAYYADRFNLAPKLSDLADRQGPFRVGLLKDSRLAEVPLFADNYTYVNAGIDVREGYTSFSLKNWGALQSITNETAKIDLQNISMIADCGERSQGVVLRPNLSALPRAKFYNQIKFYETPTQVFHDLETGAIDYHQVVAVLRPPSDLSLLNYRSINPPRDDDCVEIVRRRPGVYVLRYNVHSPGVIFLSESFYPGWQATPDRDFQIINAFGAFVGVFVPAAGVGEITVKFAPGIFVQGLIVTGFAILLSAIIYFACRRHERLRFAFASNSPKASPPA